MTFSDDFKICSMQDLIDVINELGFVPANTVHEQVRGSARDIWVAVGLENHVVPGLGERPLVVELSVGRQGGTTGSHRMWAGVDVIVVAGRCLHPSDVLYGKHQI